MILVEKHIIKPSDSRYKELDNLCFLSKNLYNVTLYAIRQHYFSHKKYLHKFGLINSFVKDKQVDYKALPSQTAQQTVFLVDQNFQSFFACLKSKKVKKVRIPNYLKKDGRQIAIFTALGFSAKKLKNGFIKLAKSNIRIKTNQKKIKQVRVIPRTDHIVVEILYEVQERKLKNDNKRYASIDLGVNNLATLSSNITSSLIINGKPLKSINQFYNKEVAKEKSKLSKFNRKKSNKTNKLNFKRNNKVNDYLHKASRIIINHLDSNQINTLVIGYNKEWKQEIKIGRVNNQNFVQIPYYRFIKMLEYKAKLAGINVKIQEESYTSKCSFMDNEPIQKHETYKGRRIKRGLFKTKDGYLINADVNASLNILKKAVPNAFNKGHGIEVCSTPSTICC